MKKAGKPTWIEP